MPPCTTKLISSVCVRYPCFSVFTAGFDAPDRMKQDRIILERLSQTQCRHACVPLVCFFRGSARAHTPYLPETSHPDALIRPREQWLRESQAKLLKILSRTSETAYLVQRMYLVGQVSRSSSRHPPGNCGFSWSISVRVVGIRSINDFISAFAMGSSESMLEPEEEVDRKNTYFCSGCPAHAPWGSVPPSRVPVDYNVMRINAAPDVNTVIITSNVADPFRRGWREHGPFGNVPPARDPAPEYSIPVNHM
jgi:hypothetical protein